MVKLPLDGDLGRCHTCFTFNGDDDMKIFLVTYALKPFGTTSYHIEAGSRMAAIAQGDRMVKHEGGGKLKEAREWKGAGDHYICRGW